MWEIIEQVPEYCGDKDCVANGYPYHMTLFAIDDEGFHVGDMDGDWERCEESDVISASERSDALWRDYYEYVAESGNDCCGQVYVAGGTTQEVTWQIRVRRSILGLVLCGARRNGRGPWIHPRMLPKEVREFMLVPEDSLTIEGDLPREERTFKTLEQLKAEAQEVTWQRAPSHELKGKVKIKMPLPQPRIRALVKRAARAKLAARGGDAR